MKHIILKSITMVNFRTFRKETTIHFNSSETTIKGMNATGKSTVMIAFNYLFFGKDQYGRTDFEIKPLTKSGEPVHQLDSEVSSELIIGNPTNGWTELSLKKVYHEKWTKPRGQAEAVFSGHETLYYYNDVPVTMREYNTKIETICPENLFRLLTNPLYFPTLPWQDQRKMLFDIAGTISDDEIASQNKAWMDLMKVVNAHKTLDEYKREISSEKRKIKDDIDKIPARIDEVQRSLPQEEDWQNINENIYSRKELIRGLDKEIADISASMNKEFAEYRARQTEINKKKSILQTIEFDTQKELNKKLLELVSKKEDLYGKIRNYNDEIVRIDRSVKNLLQERQGYENDREVLLAEYHELNLSKEVHFLETEFVCPTCKRPLPPDDIESRKQKLLAEYNSNKAVQVSRNITKGKELRSRIEMINEKIDEISKRYKELDIEYGGFIALKEEYEAAIVIAGEDKKNWTKACEANPTYQGLMAEIRKLEELLGEKPKSIDISEQTAKKESLQRDIESLTERIARKEQIEKGRARINELALDQKKLAQDLADLEKIEFAILGFTKARIEAIEDKVNSMFSVVRFKMFDQQVNGAESETCQIMVDGVPWSNLNNAMKINSGVDVMKTLSNHYGTYPPCWFDNSEAVNEISPLESQTIKLYVTNDKELTII